ncbi:MAG: Fis family transcriptional regulator [Acidobacteria bacterium RBG_16_70_10]|nr:MAG: Fis family transcriptional regulator [Acidobacteria bacterium RBG_16_70_10]
MNQESILVVDDEEVMRDVLRSLLIQAGYGVSLAENGPQGLAVARRGGYAAAIVDMMLPEMDGIEVLEELKRIDPELVVLMITAYASVETAIAAMKKGAFDYVAKPFKHEELLHILANGLNQRRLQDENRQLRTALRDQGRFMEIVGKSPRMLQVFQLVSQAAPSRSTILVVGESGTGKELVAKAIHAHSPRKDKAFVVVNSGSLPPDLLESNLFGHVKGAFTGAVYAKKGLFELADKGTLFFDEIGNIPLETQAKLLRVMQEREFMRLGGIDTIKVDVRVVAATNIDLHRAVEEGRFREDLYYRLNVIAIQLPPLRQRKEDIPALVQHFVDKYARENGKEVEGVTPDVLQSLMDYDWPGNVRELENVIERGVVLTTTQLISPDLIPEHVKSSPSFHLPQVSVPPEGINLREIIASFERRLIESTLEATGGVQKDAARLLGLKPTTLNEMIKRHAIPLPRDRERRGVVREEEAAAKSTPA